MRIITEMRIHKICYWPPATRDRYGKMTYGDPIQLSGRWEERNELFVARGGQQATSKVVASGLDQDVELDGVLMKGVLADVPPASTRKPFDLPKTYQIEASNKIYTLKGDDVLRIAFM